MVMVALDEVSSADLVVSSIASSLGVPESPGQSLLDLVINYLRARKMLLIIDNFEQWWPLPECSGSSSRRRIR